jgi:hypothetical protein
MKHSHKRNEGAAAILISNVLPERTRLEEAWLTFLLAPGIVKLRLRP